VLVEIISAPVQTASQAPATTVHLAQD